MDGLVIELDIAGRKVGPGHPCLIIAEAGVNHNGDLKRACQMVDIAADIGADAIKFQTFNTDELVTTEAPKAGYQKHNTDAEESSYEMLRRLELEHDEFRQLKEQCESRGILFMSTPFDKGSADFLDELGVSVFKVPSGEITNLPLIHHIAAKGKPLLVSTGMSYIGEVEKAVRDIAAVGNEQLVLLHCISCYPTEPADANLRAMATLFSAFSVPVGYSDHTTGIAVALAAVALGACVLEKHFTLDRSLPGPDHAASLEAIEFEQLVQGVREVEASLGHGRKEPIAAEFATAAVARKSLVVARDLSMGTVLDEDMIEVKRPGTGLPPDLLGYVIGRKAARPLLRGELLSLEALA
jgi:N,N'-diacetyllegionaminate synthase